MVAQAVKRQEEGGGQTGVKAQGCLVGRLLGGEGSQPCASASAGAYTCTCACVCACAFSCVIVQVLIVGVYIWICVLDYLNKTQDSRSFGAKPPCQDLMKI